MKLATSPDAAAAGTGTVALADVYLLVFHAEAVMNEDIVQGKWKELRGKVRQRWGKVTGDDVEQLKGSSEELVGLLQKRYGYERKQAAKEVQEWVNRY
jgi:uncharacterized protein YjbJ (UPF0337 family)